MKTKIVLLAVVAMFAVQALEASPLTNPNDPRVWQGATIGTFAALIYGADTPANWQLVINNGLLDDGHFNTTGFLDAPLVKCPGGFPGPLGCTGGGAGRSLDLTGTGGYAYDFPGIFDNVYGASHVDEYWVQTDNTIGNWVWDLGPGASTAIIFNTIDHTPMPQEAIESTVYLSNDLITWTQAVTQKVWLEGFQPNHGIEWDGFTYAVGTGTSSTFRYASVIWGGPGALQADGDNEINGVMGASRTFTPVPEPASFSLLLTGLAGVVAAARSRRK